MIATNRPRVTLAMWRRAAESSQRLMQIQDRMCKRSIVRAIAAERERCAAIASHFQTAQGRTILRQIEEGAVVSRLRARAAPEE
jgi:hypothetical protein